MTHYIDKKTLVEEINRQHKILMQTDHTYGAQFVLGFRQACRQIIDFLDTFEVKEVDLEKEFNNFLDNIEGVPRMWHSDEQIEWGKDIAKHFFELGLKASQNNN